MELQTNSREAKLQPQEFEHLRNEQAQAEALKRIETSPLRSLFSKLVDSKD